MMEDVLIETAHCNCVTGIKEAFPIFEPSYFTKLNMVTGMLTNYYTKNSLVRSTAMISIHVNLIFYVYTCLKY